MSEIGWYESSIRVPQVEAYGSNIENNPSYEILKRSLELVAKEHGGKIQKHVVDFSDNVIPCDIAVSAIIYLGY